MPKIIIDIGVAGLDGEYEFATTFTHRDFRTIKKLTDLRANEVMDSLNAGDMDLIVALAEIALQRAGVQHDVETLWDAEAGTITMQFSDSEVEVVPPTTESPSNDEESRDSESEGSGSDTRSDTDISPEMWTPNGSGTPEPDSSPSDPVTSGI